MGIHIRLDQDQIVLSVTERSERIDEFVCEAMFPVFFSWLRNEIQKAHTEAHLRKRKNNKINTYLRFGQNKITKSCKNHNNKINCAQN